MTSPVTGVLKAIGQKLDGSGLMALDTSYGKITVSDDYQTSVTGVFAGGDCISRGEDLTVQAVEDGKQAALFVDSWLQNN